MPSIRFFPQLQNNVTNNQINQLPLLLKPRRPGGPAGGRGEVHGHAQGAAGGGQGQGEGQGEAPYRGGWVEVGGRWVDVWVCLAFGGVGGRWVDVWVGRCVGVSCFWWWYDE